MRRTSYSTLCWQIRHTSLITFCLYDIQNTTLYYVGLIILTLWWSSGFRPWGVPGVLPGLQSPSRYIIVVSLFVGSHLTTHCHSGLVSPAAWDCETVRVQDPSNDEDSISLTPFGGDSGYVIYHFYPLISMPSVFMDLYFRIQLLYQTCHNTWCYHDDIEKASILVPYWCMN
jgi:hypothetical protein